MTRRPPMSPSTDTLFPHTTRVRSARGVMALLQHQARFRIERQELLVAGVRHGGDAMRGDLLAVVLLELREIRAMEIDTVGRLRGKDGHGKRQGREQDRKSTRLNSSH